MLGKSEVHVWVLGLMCGDWTGVETMQRSPVAHLDGDGGRECSVQELLKAGGVQERLQQRG